MRCFAFSVNKRLRVPAAPCRGSAGKKTDVAHEQDALTYEMIALAKAAKAEDIGYIDLIVDGLFVTITNVNFDRDDVASFTRKIGEARAALGAGPAMETKKLFHGDENALLVRAKGGLYSADTAFVGHQERLRRAQHPGLLFRFCAEHLG